MEPSGDLSAAGSREDLDLALERVLALMPDAALAVDDAGTIVSANPQAVALFGHADGELLGLAVDLLIPESVRERHAGHRERYARERTTRRMGEGPGLEARRRDGSVFPAEIMLSAVAMGDKPLTIAAVRDVSSRRDELARARLAAVVESSADAILAKDLDGTVTEWNVAAEALYGYSRAEIVGQSVMAIVPPDRHEETRAVMARIRDGDTVPVYRTVRLAKGGERIDVAVAISPIRDGAGAVVGLSTIARDIRTQLSAEADRAYTQLLFEHSADVILAVDRECRITAWNPAATALFGLAADDALGSDVMELLSADAGADERRRFLGDALAGITRVYEARRTLRDGRTLDLSIALSPLRQGDGGEIAGAIAIVRDVSAIVQAQTAASAAALREAGLRDELNQARRLESLGQLAGGVAHDFNNLLGVILNYAQFVADELPEGSAAREDVEEIRRAAERGADLTRQLLIFSRREVVRPEVLAPNDLIGDLQSLLRRALGERVDLRTALAPDVARIRADRGQLEQVLVNLAVNGRDAMPAGGILEIATGNLTLADEDVDGHLELGPGDYVLIAVTDTGTGMPADVVERAFEPFFTTKPKGSGTGLGLATVYGIVREAGGRVALYSEPGHGTSVKIYLPATEQATTGAVAGDAVGAGPAARGEAILVVEDQDEVRRMAERILTGAGYRVVTVDSGEHALQRASEQRFDLVLTDVIMPGMLGPELARELRRTQPETKVMFMSGYSDRMLSADEHAGTTFVEKPFSAAQLRASVRAVLDGD